MSKKVKGLSWDLLIHLGETVRAVLEGREITPEELAASTDEPIEYVRNVISGRADISPEFAAELETALGVKAYFWMGLQKNYNEELQQLTRGWKYRIVRKLFDLYKKFACWIGWHSPSSMWEHIRFDGCSEHCRCPWCGFEGMVDSQGNLF